MEANSSGRQVHLLDSWLRKLFALAPHLLKAVGSCPAPSMSSLLSSFCGPLMSRNVRAFRRFSPCHVVAPCTCISPRVVFMLFRLLVSGDGFRWHIKSCDPPNASSCQGFEGRHRGGGCQLASPAPKAKVVEYRQVLHNVVGDGTPFFCLQSNDVFLDHLLNQLGQEMDCTPTWSQIDILKSGY